MNLMQLARTDTRPDVCDLTVGIYRDETGAIPLMASVREADIELANICALHEYHKANGSF